VLNRTLVFAAGVAIALAAFTQTAATQQSDNPWDPKVFSQSELIDFGTFDRSPIELPWDTERVEQVASRSGVDFRHVLDADFGEVRDFFIEKYRNEKPVATLKSFATPKGASSELLMYGRSRSSGSYRFVLGNSDLRRKYDLVLERKQGETVLTFQNVAYSMVFSGGVPERAPFTPVDADPIPVQD